MNVLHILCWEILRFRPAIQLFKYELIAVIEEKLKETFTRKFL
jgi:hypothetical protein